LQPSTADRKYRRSAGGVENAMVTEIAQIDVSPGMESEFEAGVGKARAIFGRVRGFKRRSRCIARSSSRSATGW